MCSVAQTIMIFIPQAIVDILLKDRMFRLLSAIILLQVFAAHGAHRQVTVAGTALCDPQNMTLSSVAQELRVTWHTHSSCVRLTDKLTYELVVLVEDKQVHQKDVMADVSSVHRWSWKASLPLECASHSIRIRSKYKNLTSSWITETLSGKEPSGEIEVFPQDHVFEVGSRVTFCCIVPSGQTSVAMFVNNYNFSSNTSLVNKHTYALTVDLLWPTGPSEANVICKTQTAESGACTTVGYPPTDTDLKCETRDFKSVHCVWKRGPQIPSNPTKYSLLDQPCTGEPEGECTQIVKVENGKRNWILKAQNVLGTTELVDVADLTKRVHMYAPKDVRKSMLSTRNVTLRWSWTNWRYSLLNLTCKISLWNGSNSLQMEKIGLGLQEVVLDGLNPNRKYSAKVQCATAMHFWKWSEWSKPIAFNTIGDAPDALDVWMHTVNSSTIITWKLLDDRQSHGQLLDYEVTWIDKEDKDQENKIHVVHPNRSVSLSLKSYIVKVTARNAYGSSEPSQIIISRQSPVHPDITTSRINSTGGGFRLDWVGVGMATCGYIVDWCPVSGDCMIEWQKVPPNITSATIYSKNFRDGVRYAFSIYTCTDDAMELLERREGYLKELWIPDNMFKRLWWQQHASDVEISWDKVSLEEQSAFITGYVLYCTNESAVVRVTTADPLGTRLTVRNLNISSYRFTVRALTAVGECGATTITAILSSQNDDWIVMIITSLVTVFTLLLVISAVCCRHWAFIKQSVYPTIPKPVLIETLSVRQAALPYCPKEEFATAVPKLHRIPSE